MVTSMKNYIQLVQDLYAKRSSYEEEAGTRHPRVAADLLRMVNLCPGMIVLDVGTGTGLIARLVSAQIGKQGRITAIDFSESMLTQARTKAEALKLKNIDFQNLDANEASFPEHTFDLIVCCEAIVLLHDIPAVLRAWHRWLRPGGHIAFTCTHKDSYFAPVLQQAIERTTNQSPPEHMHQLLGTPQLIKTELEKAGFSATEVQSQPSGRMRALSEVSCNRPGLTLIFKGASVIQSLGEDQITSTCRLFCAELSSVATSEGVWEDTGLFLVHATRPD